MQEGRVRVRCSWKSVSRIRQPFRCTSTTGLMRWGDGGIIIRQPQGEKTPWCLDCNYDLIKSEYFVFAWSSGMLWPNPGTETEVAVISKSDPSTMFSP